MTPVLTLGLGAVVFPVLIGMTTYNFAVRYYFASMALLYVIGLVIALGSRPSSEKVTWLPTAMVSAVVLFCLYWNCEVSLGDAGRVIDRFPLLSRNINDLYYRIPPLHEEDLTVKIAAELKKIPPSGGKWRIAVLPTDLAGGWPYSQEPEHLKIVLQEGADLDWKISYFSDRRALSNFDFLLVGPIEGVISDAALESLAKEVQAGDSGGFSLLGRFQIKDNRNNGTFLLARIPQTR